MILGTASHVDKSILAAALGWILADDGFRVAPFKAQNVSLNSAATADGSEIRQTWAPQVEACRAVASSNDPFSVVALRTIQVRSKTQTPFIL